MPSISIAQQRLMGQAYALKKGEIKLEDISSEWRDKIKEISDSMTIDQLKDYAKTSHENIPLKKESVDENSTIATLGSINGMSSTSMPANPSSEDYFINQESGSGDLPKPLNKKNKKKKTFMNFKDFIESNEVRTAF